MIELIKYEIKKIFSLKALLLFSMLLLLNGFKIYSDYSYTDSELFRNGYIKIYDQIRGQITNEKISFLTNEYLMNKEKVDAGNYDTDKVDPNTYSGYVFGDMNLFHDFLEEYQSFLNYQTYSEEIRQTAKENTLLYDSSSQMNERIMNSFQDRRITYYYNTEGFSSLYDYEFSTFLCLIVSLFCCILLFCSDEENQMNFIYTTVTGKKKILIAKLFSAFLLTSFSSIIFYLEDFILFSSTMIIDGYLNPIYSLPAFSASFLNCSIIAGYLLLCLSRFLGICIILSICILFSIFKPKTLLSFLFSFIFLLLLILLPASFWNPVSLFLIQNDWASSEFINVFNFSLLNYEIIYLFMTAELIIISLFLNFTIRKGLYERKYLLGNKKNKQE